MWAGAPSYEEVVRSMPAYNLPSVRYEVPHCSHIEDIPDK